MSKIVAIIPARAGSKRLPYKNKILLCGKPIICWTIDEALKCDFIDEIIVSTNDLDIEQICIDYWLNQLPEKSFDFKLKSIVRPEMLCQDDTPMWKVIDHACLGYPKDTIIILLQPTSPLRIKDDIYIAYDKFIAYCHRCVISVNQTSDKSFVYNGAIYINYLIDILNNSGFQLDVLYIMPKERSTDIDTIEDFTECERILKERDKK